MRKRVGSRTIPLSRIIRCLVLLAGLALLGGMGWHVGLTGLVASYEAIGPWIIPFLLLDSLSLLLHTAGWAACFPGHPLPVGWWRLCLVRMAGSAINQVTPTADLGGEVAKVVFLTSSLPRAEAVAAVVIDKASMALAQTSYLALGTWFLAHSLPLPHRWQLGVRLSMSLVALGVGGFVVLQRYGVFSTLVSGLGRLTLGQARLHRVCQRLAPVDAHLVAYYTAHPWRFGRSLLLHVLAFGWDGMQTYILLRLLVGEHAPGLAQALMVAMTVAALEQLTFFVPGSVGTLEGIRFTALAAFGVGQVYGVAFGLIARLHQLFWNGLGLLAYMRCTRRAPGAGRPRLLPTPSPEGLPGATPQDVRKEFIHNGLDRVNEAKTVELERSLSPPGGR